MDKCREEFEIFWTARCCGLGVECNLTTLINGDYYDIKAYYAWIGWSERQKSMKAIKLPEVSEFKSIDVSLDEENETIVDIFFEDDYKFAIIEAITSAGYKMEE